MSELRVLTLPRGGLREAMERRRAGIPVDPAPPDPAFLEKIGFILEFTGFVKRDLDERSATSGEYVCPICGAAAFAAVAGRKRHVRISCATPDCVSVLE